MAGPNSETEEEEEFTVYKGIFEFDEEVYEALETVFNGDSHLQVTMELAKGGPQRYDVSGQYATRYIPYLDRYLWEHGLRFRDNFIELDVDNVQ